MYFKDISQQIKDKRKNRQIRPVDWKEYDDSSTLRLNPHVQKYDGFTPRRESFRGGAKNADWGGRYSQISRLRESDGLPSHAGASIACKN